MRSIFTLTRCEKLSIYNLRRYFSKKNSRITSLPTRLENNNVTTPPKVSLDNAAITSSAAVIAGGDISNITLNFDPISGGRKKTNTYSSGSRHKLQRNKKIKVEGVNLDDNRQKNENYEYLYGISPVYMCLLAGRRIVSEALIQEGLIDNFATQKKDPLMISKILQLCQERNIPIRYTLKHDLNMISDNKPHQGVVLRTNLLSSTSITALPRSNKFKCILALDEVTDPQNLGALIRSYFFLTQHVSSSSPTPPSLSSPDSQDVGIVICQKNSAPLSPTVSKASSGALESMNIHSTKNMMKFLELSKENGWHIVGTSSHEGSREVLPLHDLRLDKPIVVVLGNEGHGIRKNILNRCETLVTITSRKTPRNSLENDLGNVSTDNDKASSLCTSPTRDGVDSLNVSVCGGIILHHILLNSN